MNRILATLAICAAFAAPAFAQDTMTPETMTCANFADMDAAGQAEAMTAMETAMMASATPPATTGDAMSAEDKMAAMMTACEGNDDMMAMDAMTQSMSK